MRDTSPSFDERYHQRYLFFKEQIREMQRVKLRKKGLADARGEPPPPARVAEAEDQKAPSRWKGDPRELESLRKSPGPILASPTPERGIPKSRNGPPPIAVPSPIAIAKRAIETRRSGSPSAGSNSTIKNDFQTKRPEPEQLTPEKKGKPESVPTGLLSHLATGSLADKVDRIQAIEGTIKEQKNTKSQILTDMFGLQQEKNKILAELQEREKRNEEKIAELEAENAALITKLALAEAEWEAEREEAAFAQTELRLHLESAQKEALARDRTISGLEERLRKLEADKEAMGEVIKNFIAPKSPQRQSKKR